MIYLDLQFCSSKWMMDFTLFLVLLLDEKDSGIDSEIIALFSFRLQTHDWVQQCDQTQSGLCLQKYKVNWSISHSEDCCLQKADNQYSFGQQAYWKTFKLMLRKKRHENVQGFWKHNLHYSFAIA